MSSGLAAARYGSIVTVVAATGYGSGRAEIAQLVEHATENRGVASSILALGTTTSGRSGRQSSGSGSAGRASPCQGEGRGFEPRLPLHFLPTSALAARTPLALRLVVGQRTLDPLTVVRILEGQPNQRGRLEATYPSGLRGRSAKPLFTGSNPVVASNFTLNRPYAASHCLAQRMRPWTGRSVGPGRSSKPPNSKAC